MVRIFNPYTQVSGDSAHTTGGTGLGLGLSRNLSELLGGSVSLVRSKVNEGSHFRVTIGRAPYELESASDQDAAVSKATVHGATALNNKSLDSINILLVEDFIPSQDLMRLRLMNEGATVTVAENGQMGAIAALNGDYDVVLIDLELPVLDGYSAVALQRSKGYKQPIIALTGHAIETVTSRCLELGFDDQLCKPTDFPTLIERVLHHSSVRSKTQASALVNSLSKCDL